MEKWSSSLFLRRKCFSKAKAEKVVNPPQKPVAKNKVLFWERMLPLTDRPKISPISRHPIILTKKVPRKKFGDNGFRGFEMAYRRTLPNPPPKKTRMACFIPKGTNYTAFLYSDSVDSLGNNFLTDASEIFWMGFLRSSRPPLTLKINSNALMASKIRRRLKNVVIYLWLNNCFTKVRIFLYFGWNEVMKVVNAPIFVENSCSVLIFEEVFDQE